MIGWKERLWIGLFAAPLCAAAPGCLKDPGFACESNAVCFLDGVSGECDLSSAKCVYPTEGCTGFGGYRDGEGNCVAPPNGGDGVTSNGSSNTNGDPSSNPSTTGNSATTSEPIEDDDDTTPTSGDITTTTTPGTETDTSVDPTDPESESSSGGGFDCASQLESITSQGLVSVSSTFPGYNADLSVDGDVSTSWFSEGPEGGGAPSVYTWTTQVELCISRVFVADNAQHANSEFRDGYGFASATVRVFNEANTAVYEEVFQLPGTPDGDITVNTGGVLGNRVVLELAGHENPSCGGFSELQVLGGLL